MIIDEWLKLLSTDVAKAEEYLQNPDCPTDIKREYLGEFDTDD